MYLGGISGMSRDRTTDFIKYRRSDIPYSLSPYKRDTETSRLLPSKPDRDFRKPEIEYFFDITEQLKIKLSHIDIEIDEMMKLQQKCLRLTFDDPSEQRERVNNITMRISAQFKEIFTAIKQFKSNSTNNDHIKIINNLQIRLLEVYKALSTKFNTAQQTFQASYNKASSFLQPESDDAVNFDDFGLGGVSQTAELEHQQNNEIINELALRAEQVRDIFEELASMISMQGTLIDRIDYNIEHTLENAEKAHESIVKAAKYQKKSRMYICAIILVFLIILLLIIAILRK